jgi:hypothetical protein
MFDVDEGYVEAERKLNIIFCPRIRRGSSLRVRNWVRGFNLKGRTDLVPAWRKGPAISNFKQYKFDKEKCYILHSIENTEFL